MPLSAWEIIGHRGASHDAPENTLASFKLGWEQGADVDELDVYLSKDGQVVVMHDANTKRTTGRDKPIVEQTLVELRELDAGSWKGPQWAGEKTPTLAEVIAIIPDGKRLFIEVKCGPEIVPELGKVLAASGKKPEQLVLISFNWTVLAEARKAYPQYATYWLADNKQNADGEFPKLEDLLAKVKEGNLDGLNLSVKFPLDRDFVGRAKEGGRKLYAWTVDDPAVAQRLFEAGVDGLGTNRPGWLREQLAKSTLAQKPMTEIPVASSPAVRSGTPLFVP